MLFALAYGDGMETNMRIILCGGGTAGHVNPALAIAEEIKRRDEHSDILFVGRSGGDENNIMTRAGYALKTLTVQGFDRRITLKNLKSLGLAISATREARKIIRSYEPDIVLGTGGYVCWPLLRAAARLGIPTVLHESNIYPGLTTRLLSPKVSLMLLNNGKTLEYLKRRDNTRVVGNPLRCDFEKISRQAARARLALGERDVFILSFGGSIGAAVLNEAVIKVMKEFSGKAPHVRHIHGTGRRFYDEIRTRERSLCGEGKAKIVPYVENVPELMRAADIVVSRCGAMTLSELAAAGVASILVPSPNVTDNHQVKNARALSDADAAIMMEEHELVGEKLRTEISRLVYSPKERARLARRIKSFDKPNAASKIVELLQGITNSAKQ